MGALYLASKLEECPIRMRDLINVCDLLLCRARYHNSSSSSSSSASGPRFSAAHSALAPPVYTPMSYFAQEFYDLKDALVVAEMQILKRLGFNVQVQLPYGTMVNYLQVLGLAGHEQVPQSCWDYLNDALVYFLISVSEDCVEVMTVFHLAFMFVCKASNACVRPVSLSNPGLCDHLPFYTTSRHISSSGLA